MPATALLTSERFLELPDELDQFGNRIPQELIQGEVVNMPPPSKLHAVVQARIAQALIVFLAANGHLKFMVLTQAAVVASGQDTFVPDVAVISTKRLDTLDEKYFHGVPEIAVEVVSPSDRATRLKKKVDTYLAGGSNAVWVVFPDSRSVMVHSGDSVRELKADQVIEDPLLPGFSAPVSSFFDLTFSYSPL